MQQVKGGAARRQWSLSAAKLSPSQAPKVDPVVILILHWFAKSHAVHVTLHHSRSNPTILELL